MRPLRLACLLFCLAAPALAAGSQNLVNELAVRVVNKSTPELCAERDNVELDFISPDVRHMEIQATHPAYIGMINTDRWAPDFSACNIPHGEGALPRKTFYEFPTLRLTGLTDPDFWRPANVPILRRRPCRAGLQLHPAVDAFPRARGRNFGDVSVGRQLAHPSLPYGDMRWTAYGSSFQIGPLEMQEGPGGARPVVAISDIAFDPAKKAFTLNFKRGGSATVTLKQVDQDHVALDVSYSGAMPDSLPFAAMRSMYTNEGNSDVARIAWREKDGKGWGESPVLSFPGALATEVCGRTQCLLAAQSLGARHGLFALPAMSDTQARLPLVDFLRGLALWAMLVFHLVWDLAQFGWIDHDAPYTPIMHWFGHAIAVSFLALVGVSLVLAETAKGPLWRSAKFWRRWAEIVLAASAISAVSFWLFPTTPIFFGILHCIALASLFALPFVAAPPIRALAGGFAALLARIFSLRRFSTTGSSGGQGSELTCPRAMISGPCCRGWPMCCSAWLWVAGRLPASSLPAIARR